MRYLGWLMLLFSLVGALFAAEKAFVFTNKAQQAQFESLVKEIRCVTCPNQTIGDSQAPIARAMKEEIYRRLQQGESEEEIRAYLLMHYGDYISYRPPLEKETWLLWWGPLIMLSIGLVMTSSLFLARRRKIA